MLAEQNPDNVITHTRTPITKGALFWKRTVGQHDVFTITSPEALLAKQRNMQLFGVMVDGTRVAALAFGARLSRQVQGSSADLVMFDLPSMSETQKFTLLKLLELGTSFVRDDPRFPATPPQEIPRYEEPLPGDYPEGPAR